MVTKEQKASGILSQALWSRRARGGVAPLPLESFLLMCPFLLMSPFNVLFLKEVTKIVHENQQAKSQAS